MSYNQILLFEKLSLQLHRNPCISLGGFPGNCELAAGPSRKSSL